MEILRIHAMINGRPVRMGLPMGAIVTWREASDEERIGSIGTKTVLITAVSQKPIFVRETVQQLEQQMDGKRGDDEDDDNGQESGVPAAGVPHR